MLSMRPVHAGKGYRYLLRSVATNDADPNMSKADRLHDYYAAKGTPSGKWLGAGISAFGSETIIEGAAINEDQMSALYGEGLHPEADAMLENGATIADCKLGRSFPIYTNSSDVLTSLSSAEKAFRTKTGKRPNEEERAQLALSAGTKHFTDAHGRSPVDGREVIAWVNREQDNVKQAVGGYDMTFSPVKSVSVLWALSDKETAQQIAAAHHEAVAEAITWVEDNALFSRVGKGGIKQVKTNGLVASEFTHFDTRAGDPDLHSHVLIANKVQIAEGDHAGEWKAIDGKQFFEHKQTAGGVYNVALQHKLSERLGIEFDARYRSADAAPVWEVSGISDTVVDTFSQRRAGARPIYNQLLDSYVAKHHRQPSRRANYELWQQAILQTRDAKKPAESLDELRSQWSATATDSLGHGGIKHALSSVRSAGNTRAVFDADAHTEGVARDAVSFVLSRRSTFRRSHLHTAVSAKLHNYRFASEDHRRSAYEHVMATALNDVSVCLTPGEMLILPKGLTIDGQTAIDRKNNTEIYSTEAHLAREDKVMAAASEPAPIFVDREKIDSALEDFAERRGFELNDGQRTLAEHLLNAGTVLAVGVGPAGTGKTTSMEVVTNLWGNEGRNVIGLAPSAAAAQVLQEDIGTDCHTIDRLTFAWNLAAEEGLSPAERAGKLPIDIKRGDMLLVDEAGMASTDKIATLHEIAEETGAVIRMVGDPAQLDAVETGGMFRSLAAAPGTPVLNDVMRMGDDHVQAEATLQIRDGNAAGLDVHAERGWIHEGHRDAMLTAAVDAHIDDTESGKRSLVIAPTNADVATMNEMIRAHEIDSGRVDTSRERTLSDGLAAGKGDTILARKNYFFDYQGSEGVRVLNGQLLTVDQINDNGTIDARDQKTNERVHLPEWYIEQATQLGYAATLHRSQGATVDTTHCVVDGSVDRNGLYVGLTRGKVSNELYVDTAAAVDFDAEGGHMHHSGDEAAPTAREILAAVVANDAAQRSATDTIRDQLDKATSTERIGALYAEGNEIATRVYVNDVVPDLVDGLPAEVAGRIETDRDGLEAIEHAASYAANRGVDVRDLWFDAVWSDTAAKVDPDTIDDPGDDNVGWARSPGRLIASRLRHMTDEKVGDRVDALPSPPPHTVNADPELAQWLAQTQATLNTPRAGEPAPEAPLDPFAAAKERAAGPKDPFAAAKERTQAGKWAKSPKTHGPEHGSGPNYGDSPSPTPGRGPEL